MPSRAIERAPATGARRPARPRRRAICRRPAFGTGERGSPHGLTLPQHDEKVIAPLPDARPVRRRVSMRCSARDERADAVRRTPAGMAAARTGRARAARRARSQPRRKCARIRPACSTASRPSGLRAAPARARGETDTTARASLPARRDTARPPMGTRARSRMPPARRRAETRCDQPRRAVEIDARS